MENLHDFYFHFNIYTNKWNAFLRSDSNLYMNGFEPNPDYSLFSDENINKIIDKIISLESQII